MKKTYRNQYRSVFFSALIGLLILSACSPLDSSMERNIEKKFHIKEGERFKTTFGIDAELLQAVQVRTRGIEEIKDVTSLRVLVFDEKGNFLYSEDATLKDVGGVAGLSDDDFLPDLSQDHITKIKKFTVSLVKSSKKRYVHFVANHNWTGFKQDYFAVGTSAGEFMTDKSLVDTVSELEDNQPTNLALWSRYETENDKGLDENTFNGKVVKLLRNYAKVTIKMTADINTKDPSKTFQLESYTLCNLSDRGSIAPFVTHGYEIAFPFSPSEASEPIETKLHNDEQQITQNTDLALISSSKPYYIFERDNVRAQKKTYMIIKGRRDNNTTGVHDTRYYKIDLIRRKQVDSDNPDDKKGINTYFPFIRNKHYIVNIEGINSDGYATLREAIEAPAGNNVFADTKLEDFEQISDGTFSLSIDPIQLVIVKRGTYPFNVFYSATDGNRHIKYYPSWNVKDAMSSSWSPNGNTPEAGYEYTEGTDAFMAGLKKTDNGFEIEVKDIPSDATKFYEIEVVALRQHDGQFVDGVTGATPPLTRKVKIKLNSPYPFNAKLEDTDLQTTHNLTFQVYEQDLIPKALLPFPVYIKAEGLTPVNASGKQNVTIERIKNPETGKIEIFYKYMVQESDQTVGKASIPFKVNNPDFGSGTITLTSEFYQDQIINNNKVSYYNAKLDLRYKKPIGYTTSITEIPNTADFVFKINNKDFTSRSLAENYNIFFASSGNNHAIFTMSMPKKIYDAQKNTPLTISSVEHYAPTNMGYVKYTFSKTLTVAEWMKYYVENEKPYTSNFVWDFTTTEVEIKGRVYYFSWSGAEQIFFQKPSTTQYFYGNDLQWSKYNEIDLSSDFKVEDKYEYDDRGSAYYNFILKSTNMDAFTKRSYLLLMYEGYDWSGYIGKAYSDLRRLESKPMYEMQVK
ncbi:fimbrial protein [Bacteroides pyogenes]|uniref:fimbrial protein n=1 Tax=Bacteroides pyogenes TaxID=310300 RepID=UPI001BA4E288|nr:fimbrial protein [Bacteroides pyogenes]MBR8706193.1 hypothetical protein [Bacteroides pyogenes]